MLGDFPSPKGNGGLGLLLRTPLESDSFSRSFSDGVLKSVRELLLLELDFDGALGLVGGAIVRGVVPKTASAIPQMKNMTWKILMLVGISLTCVGTGHTRENSQCCIEQGTSHQCR